ncbi:MAG: nicotinamide riboside transporter PnuC [Oceanicoccus sp.]
MTVDSLLSQLMSAYAQVSGWEVIAVILALVYLLLAVQERIECWYAAFASTSIYIFLFWNVNLLMESVLQLYYLAMAIYGWWQWRLRTRRNDRLSIQVWSLRRHGLVITSVCLLVFLSGYLLEKNTSAALPYLDSLTTWGAVITTYMVAHKVLENWLYWLFIDGVSIYLYIDRELYFTALLFVLYIVIAVFGYFRWRTLYMTKPAVSYE